MFPGDGVTPAELIKHADTAMYRAKARGWATYQFFDPALASDAYAALVLEGDDSITGDLLRLTDPAASLPWLDAFESCGPDDPPPHDYRREIGSVMTASGAVEAMVYVWNWSVEGLERIASGDWLAIAP